MMFLIQDDSGLNLRNWTQARQSGELSLTICMTNEVTCRKDTQ